MKRQVATKVLPASVAGDRDRLARLVESPRQAEVQHLGAPLAIDDDIGGLQVVEHR